MEDTKIKETVEFCRLAPRGDIIDVLARNKEEYVLWVDEGLRLSKLPEHQSSLDEELSEPRQRLSSLCGKQASEILQRKGLVT